MAWKFKEGDLVSCEPTRRTYKITKTAYIHDEEPVYFCVDTEDSGKQGWAPEALLSLKNKEEK